MFRPRYFLMLLIPLCLFLTGCQHTEGAEEARTSAKLIETEYTEEFRQKVIEYFGEDVQLKGVSGRIRVEQYGVWFDKTAYSLPVLDGVLLYDGCEYEISYDVETKELMSTFNLEKAKEALFAQLPLDTSQIVYSYVYDSNHETPQFSLAADADMYGLTDYRNNLFWYILTTEDISDLHKEDFVDYLSLEQKCAGTNDINIFSCKDDQFSNIDHFERHITSIAASDYGKHPKVYYGQDMTDIFPLYNLKNTCFASVESFQTDTGRYETDLEFYLLSDMNAEEPVRQYRFFLNPDNDRSGAIDSDEYRWLQ